MKISMDRKLIDKKMIKTALFVAAFVGTILLFINQYDAIFGDAPIRVLSAMLTYFVPFVVFISGRLSNKK
jgi:hypothetical protein